MKMRSIPTVFLSVALLFLSACGQFAVGLETTPTTADVQVTRPTPQEPQSTAEETVTIQPEIEEVSPTKAANDFSRYWVETWDPHTGVRFALPCSWYALFPQEFSTDAVAFSYPLQNYTDEFAMSYPLSIEGLWESGAIKIDMNYLSGPGFGVAPGAGLLDFVNTMYANNDETKLVSTQEVQINGQPALLVTTESTFGTGQFYLFAVSDVLYLAFGTRVEVMQSPDVQGILNSIAINPERPVQIPNQMPANPPIGLEASCLQEGSQSQEQPLPEHLDCAEIVEDTAAWVACNVQDGILSRNLSALLGYMVDPFIVGNWASEGRSISPQEVLNELTRSWLPINPALPMTFTMDRSQFPPLAGQPVETMLAPDVNVVEVIYSEGWGLEGQGAALLFITQDSAGKYYWHGLILSPEHFDK